MGRSNELVYALNAGGIDKAALSRIDLEKMRLSGEHPVANWLPKVLGPMTVRPGFEMLGAVEADKQTRYVEFARSINTKYVIALSEFRMKIISDGEVVQVPDVATTISTGSWSDQSTGSATATGGSELILNATTTNAAKIRQTVSVASDDRSVKNILRVVVASGPVFLRIGTTAGGQELFSDKALHQGTHKLSVTPGVANMYVEIRSEDPVERRVSQINFEASYGTGDFYLPTPWSWDQLQQLRTWQSIDVVFAGDGEQKQRRISNYNEDTVSWSLDIYDAINGPYAVPGGNLTVSPSALSGNITMTSSEPFFLDGHVGSLIELTQVGKTVSQTLDGEDQATDYVTVTGIDAERIFYRTGAGSSFVGTLTLQRSVELEDPSVWSDFATYVDGAATFSKSSVDDNQDNLTAHYRFTVKSGDYTSGSVVATLEYENATQTGQGKITSLTSSTSVRVETHVNFGSTNATRLWRIGAWSDVSGWPRTPVIHDDRLHWFDSVGRDYASEVGDYVDFDDTLEGDSAPFVRSISGGSLEGVLWAQSGERLIVGTAGFEATIQANDFDGALTPTSYTSRKPSRRGCADLESVSHHAGIFYVQRSGKRIYEISIPGGDTKYRSRNVSRMNPSACQAGIARLAIQLQPETRLYAVLDDGTMVVLSYEIDDDVVAFTTITIPGGLIEDVCVLSGAEQDDVYVLVNRGGSRYHMRMEKEASQEAVDTCALLDYHKVITGSVRVISGATHLASTTVQVWADGQRRADVTLDASGIGYLDGTYARVVYGLNYDAEFTSVKPAYAAQLGSSVGQEKILRNVGLVVSNSCLDGLMVGVKMRDEPILSFGVPDKINGSTRAANQFFDHLDLPPWPLAAAYDADTRLYLKASSAEGPVTIQSVVMDVETPETYTPRS